MQANHKAMGPARLAALANVDKAYAASQQAAITQSFSSSVALPPSIDSNLSAMMSMNSCPSMIMHGGPHSGLGMGISEEQ